MGGPSWCSFPNSNTGVCVSTGSFPERVTKYPISFILLRGGQVQSPKISLVKQKSQIKSASSFRLVLLAQHRNAQLLSGFAQIPVQRCQRQASTQGQIQLDGVVGQSMGSTQRKEMRKRPVGRLVILLDS
jgi:hypothetical protein